MVASACASIWLREKIFRSRFQACGSPAMLSAPVATAVMKLDRPVVDCEVKSGAADHVLVGLPDALGGLPVSQAHHPYRWPARPKALGRLALAEAPDTPGDQRAHRLSQIAAVVGQLVDLPGGRRRKLSAADDALAFERT